MKNKEEITMGMLKPEALTRGLQDEIKQRIINANLSIIGEVKIILTKNEFNTIYGSVKEPAWLHQARKKHLTTQESLILIIKGRAAVSKLLLLRGTSNPSQSEKNTIRGDFAHDQDYTLLRQQKKMALNIFHATDSEAEAVKILKTINKRIKLYSNDLN